MSRRTSSGGSIAALAILLCGATPGPQEFRASGVVVLDVGQGAAMMVLGDAGEVVMIDSGPASGAEVILRALATRGISRVDLWVHTHFDADHVGGVSRVMLGADGRAGTGDEVEIAEAWDRGDDDLPQTDAVGLYFAMLGDRRSVPTSGAAWTSSHLRVVAHTTQVTPADRGENARGLGLCIDLGDRRILIPGDLPAQQVAQLAETCGPVDVLWASHHGSDDGISGLVLERADPQLVLVSAGRDNAYCHPSAPALAMLRDYPTWITAIAGAQGGTSCGDLAGSWAAAHTVVGGDIWLPLAGDVDVLGSDEAGRAVVDFIRSGP